MIEAPWADDRLNRKADGEHLVKVLKERYEARKAAGNGSYILNIDASWGQGKTFFLQNLRTQLQSDGHLVAYVNAWKDDHANDPLITVMAAIEGELKPMFPEVEEANASLAKGKRALGIIVGETAKQVGFHMLKTVTGIAVGSTFEKLKEAGALDASIELDDDAFSEAAEKVWDKGLESLVGERVASHIKANEAVSEFKKETANSIAAVAGNGMLAPMFVFVDELDRCRPLYAIKLLEDLKHLFDIDGLVFVVATDSDQLAHSVKAIYGADFEARKYLRRFFDRVFVFPEANRADFIQSIFDAMGVDLNSKFFDTGGVPPLVQLSAWADGLKLSNRDIVQISDIISTFVTSFEHACKIELNYLLALSTAFYSGDDDAFQFLCGNEPAETSFFTGWSIVTFRKNSGRFTERLSESSTNYLRTLANMANNNDLEQLAHHSQDSLQRKYFNSEMSALHPQGYFTNDVPTSVLREYPSRVRNAGRVIDRK